MSVRKAIAKVEYRKRFQRSQEEKEESAVVRKVNQTTSSSHNRNEDTLLAKDSSVEVSAQEIINHLNNSSIHFTLEDVRDIMGDALVEGDNINITVNDSANTITISAPNMPDQDILVDDSGFVSLVGTTQEQINNDIDTKISNLVNDAYFSVAQSTPSATWTINHGLGKRPSVTVVDSANTVVEGEVEYIDNNNLIIKFQGGFTGTAYLN